MPAAPTVSRARLVAEPWLAPLREAAGKRLWVARVPIARGEEALGLLLLASRRKAALGDIALLETVGALFASALDHARLYEAAFERERELEDQDSRRREFLYAIAHELRTPLTSIQAFADLLSERRGSRADDSPNLLDSLTRGVERLGSLVDDLLHLGRIEQAKCASSSPRWTWAKRCTPPRRSCGRPSCSGNSRCAWSYRMSRSWRWGSSARWSKCC